LATWIRMPSIWRTINTKRAKAFSLQSMPGIYCTGSKNFHLFRSNLQQSLNWELFFVIRFKDQDHHYRRRASPRRYWWLCLL
jgi:hypothetical protein